MKKIKLKISLIVTLLSMVIILSLSNTAILTNRRTAATLAAQSFPLIAEALANDVDGFISQNITLIETLASVPQFKTDIPLSEKAGILKSLTQNVAKDGIDFAVVDMAGHLITTSGAELDCSKEYYYTEVLKTGKTVIGHVVLNPVSDEFSFMITTPIMTDGLMTGVIGVALPMAVIDQMVNAVTMGSTGYVFLTDNSSTIISHPDVAMVRSRYNIDRDGEKNNSLSFSEFGRELVANKTGFTEYEFGDGKRSAAFATVARTDWRVAIAIGQKELFAGTERAIKIAFLVAFLTLAVSIIAGYLFGNSMSKPIIAVTNEVVKLKEGDLTIDVKATTKDEIGVMTTALTSGVSALRVLITSVFEETEVMKRMGQNLSANTEQTASAVNQISANIESIKTQVINQSAGVEETQATIEQIVKNIEKLNGDIEKQVQNVETSSSATEEMIANIASITRILEKNAAEVSNLGQAAKHGRESLEQTTGITAQIASESDGLLEASSIIENIAAQTNLLAMNAAIEAAHAGEAGKGFAVVADEIRKLAENAGTQSKSITQVLHKLKSDIEKLTDSAAFVQQQFTSIYDLTQAVQDQERSVTSMMQEQSTANVQVLQSIQQISEITAGVKQGSSQMLHGSREISIEMSKIAEVTRIVNDSMNEMVVGTQEINHAMQDVNLLTQQNNDSIKKLAGGVGKFKV